MQLIALATAAVLTATPILDGFQTGASVLTFRCAPNYHPTLMHTDSQYYQVQCIPNKPDLNSD